MAPARPERSVGFGNIIARKCYAATL